ncbi:hypothetical protein AAG570_003063 [Ranatra chinensis]|uniref:Basic leucine zipper domain-containing protein n=1 Tax=Ranatra chinensis TaxID=642074 RepID=A0ABD0Y6A9_9HEMI
MNLMTNNNNSDPIGGDTAGATFKMENPHDMMYYQNGAGDIGHNNGADGFLSSILNDEDLQLMDMAMNEGMYTMRMLEGSSGAGGCGNGGGGTDSDSAVSSMGSERVPSLTSDTDWMETNSDSGHTPADHFMTDYHRLEDKFRWYDYGYTRQHSGETASNGTHRMPPVAQKKYHLYGKRLFQEQTGGGGGSGGPGAAAAVSPSVVPTTTFGPPPLDMVKGHQPEFKYSYSAEFSRQNLEAAVHNHTYHLPPEHSGVLQRPLTRDKKARKSDEDRQMTRDERRARGLDIPISVDDIINLPMDEFNERLSKYDLSEAQLSLISWVIIVFQVAAQNCRKRKLDQIMSLADEVKQMKEKKQRLVQEREMLLSERLRVKNKFSQLYRHIFQALRDPEGNPYSPYEWSLQQSADGTVVLVPRGANHTMLQDQQTQPLQPQPVHPLPHHNHHHHVSAAQPQSQPHANSRPPKKPHDLTKQSPP